MAELTKEWLKQTIAEYEANRDELPFGLDTNSAIELQAFKLALASLEAEPVAYIFKHPAGKLFWALTDESNKEQSDVIPVYAAPPVPVVPEEKPMPNPLKMYAVDAVAAIAEVRGWNACRAAMLQAEPVSNSDELPLDYLQGHKDGLEWAAQLAEANHPQTGDWLYDDPIDLARAIRKGPDMPTVQAGNSPVIPDGLSTVCAEAYQVVGVMADALGVFGDAAVQKVLDNLSQQKLVHRDVLPFSLPVTPSVWMSCSERMPDDAQWCVVEAADGYYVQCWSEGQGWLGDDISLRNCDVIRWMPIPEPPQQDGK